MGTAVCPGCRGMGERDCSECDRLTEMPCVDCAAPSPCATCDGRGYFMGRPGGDCTSCSNSGIVTCAGCCGRGVVAEQLELPLLPAAQ
jgi:hypothetical protein